MLAPATLQTNNNSNSYAASALDKQTPPHRPAVPSQSSVCPAICCLCTLANRVQTNVSPPCVLCSLYALSLSLPVSHIATTHPLLNCRLSLSKSSAQRASFFQSHSSKTRLFNYLGHTETAVISPIRSAAEHYSNSLRSYHCVERLHNIVKTLPRTTSTAPDPLSLTHMLSQLLVTLSVTQRRNPHSMPSLPSRAQTNSFVSLSPLSLSLSPPQLALSRRLSTCSCCLFSSVAASACCLRSFSICFSVSCRNFCSCKADRHANRQTKREECKKRERGTARKNKHLRKYGRHDWTMQNTLVHQKQ